MQDPTALLQVSTPTGGFPHVIKQDVDEKELVEVIKNEEKVLKNKETDDRESEPLLPHFQQHDNNNILTLASQIKEWIKENIPPHARRAYFVNNYTLGTFSIALSFLVISEGFGNLEAEALPYVIKIAMGLMTVQAALGVIEADHPKYLSTLRNVFQAVNIFANNFTYSLQTGIAIAIDIMKRTGKIVDATNLQFFTEYLPGPIIVGLASAIYQLIRYQPPSISFAEHGQENIHRLKAIVGSVLYRLTQGLSMGSTFHSLIADSVRLSKNTKVMTEGEIWKYLSSFAAAFIIQGGFFTIDYMLIKRLPENLAANLRLAWIASISTTVLFNLFSQFNNAFFIPQQKADNPDSNINWNFLIFYTVMLISFATLFPPLARKIWQMIQTCFMSSEEENARNELRLQVEEGYAHESDDEESVVDEVIPAYLFVEKDVSAEKKCEERLLLPEVKKTEQSIEETGSLSLKVISAETNHEISQKNSEYSDADSCGVFGLLPAVKESVRYLPSFPVREPIFSKPSYK